VPRDLFSPVLGDPPSPSGGRWSALPISAAIHALALAVVIVVPLLATDVGPLVHGGIVSWMPVVAPPSPPPIPVPDARPARPVDVVEPAVTPVEPPRGLTPERLLRPAAPPDEAPPDRSGTIPGTGVPGGTGTVPVDAPPPTPPPAAVPVAALVKPPVKVHDVSPVYPELAIRGRVEGHVVIEAVIGPAGDVQEARVLQGKPLLTETALAAVRQWRYTPTLVSGRPVPVVMMVTVTFRLRR
jgi:protein TonB